MGWDRIRGHDDNITKLRAAHTNGRLAHAYLFVGPQGIGKQMFAKEFAKALLCERPPVVLTACDHCHSCTLANAETHPDIIEAARPEEKLELPVEVVREFCQNLGLKPSRGSRKVAILEDADSFNEESANCFLKTLEEPPPGSVLILLATATDQQLPTILSRAQIIRFLPLCVPDLELVLSLHDLGDQAKISKLARISGGSVGMALALADADLGDFRTELLRAMIQHQPDSPDLASKWLRFTEDAGKDGAAQRGRTSAVLRVLTAQLLVALRIALASPPGELDAEEREMIGSLARKCGAQGIMAMLEACVEAERLNDRRVQIALILEQLADKLCPSK